jgi:arylsulfatase A-like enzyme
MKPLLPFIAFLLSALASFAADKPATAGKPNIVIVLADDMGWRDTGYQGNTIIKTPHLDEMASKGVRFDYFYPGQQSCSPGRFAIMTGRNPCRSGLWSLGDMRPQEITVAQALKRAGYHTGQFGKWHLGNTTTSPAKMGFDKAIWSLNFFDLGDSLRVGDTDGKIPLKGDTSVAVMDLALDWMREQVRKPEPFLAYVCFGSPHNPHRATEGFKALYKNQPARMQNYGGEVSGIDTAVGNLRAELRKLGIADNTIIWFTSDNGGTLPQSQDPAGKGKVYIGVRIPGLLEWPARVKQQIRTAVVAGHVDIYPTLLDITGVTVPNQPPVDGVSLVPLLDGKMTARPKPIGFMLWPGGHGGKFSQADFIAETQGVWIDGQYKLVIGRGGKQDKRADGVQLFDIYADPAEKSNLADKAPDVVKRMHAALDNWRRDVRASFDGRDYPKKKKHETNH